MKYQAVIFDLDGTIYDNKHLGLHLVLSNPSKAFWMLSERVVRKRLSGKQFDSEELFRQTQYRMIGVKHRSTVEQAKVWYETSYMPSMVKIIGEQHQLYDWILPLIDYYRQQGCKLAIFSDYAWTRQKLMALGVDLSLFDVIADGPMLAGLKPCPRSFERVIEMLGTTPQSTLMFGDRQDTDAEGCKAVGMDFINVKQTEMNQFLQSLKK